MHRTLSIPIALLAVFAALEATCAFGAFIRVDVASIVGDCEKAELVAFVALHDSAAMDPYHLTGATPPPPLTPEPDDRPAPHDFVPAQETGACTAPTASPTHGPGSAPAAIQSIVSEAPKLLLAGHLPDEMGPRFSNPPPWDLLKVPRA